jgi:hypothetical protein
MVENAPPPLAVETGDVEAATDLCVPPTVAAADWRTCGAEQELERGLYPGCVAQRCGFFQTSSFLPAADYRRLYASVAVFRERHAGIFTAIDLHRQRKGTAKRENGF